MTVDLHRRIAAPTSMRGFSLAEMLVALALFAIAAAVASVLYSKATRSYRTAEQLILEQQNVRTGFDRMLAEIRMAGFNANPGGDPARSDEQIEGAWDTAIAFRVGAAQIVIYALGKPEHRGRDRLSFQVHGDEPGTAPPRTVTVPGLSLTHSEPPYVLYRVALRGAAGALATSSQPAADLSYEPVADGIRSLRFQYYDHEGRQLGPDTPADLSDDIGGDDSGISARSRIRSIRVSLTGMVPTESAGFPQEQRREELQGLALSSLVTPENLGKIGIADAATVALPAPENVRAVAGHCRGVLVTWNDARPASHASGIDIRYWQKGAISAASTRRLSYPSPAPWGFDRHPHGFLDRLADDATYCFQVGVVDASGRSSPWSSLSTAPCVQVTDASTPRSPDDLTATGGKPRSALDGEVQLTWSAVTNNTTILSGDPDLVDGTTVVRDLQGYKIYRDLKVGFAPDDRTNLIATVMNGATEYADHDAANCKTYYYRIVATDHCGVTSAPGPPVEGRAETSLPPSPPERLEARRSSRNHNRLTWEPVDTDTDRKQIHVERYNIYRYASLVTLPASALKDDLFALVGSIEDGATSYQDALGQPDQSDLLRGSRFYYAVTAADWCGNESARSVPVPLACQSDVIVDGTPLNGDVASGIVPLVLRPAAAGRYVSARAEIVRVDAPDEVVYDHESSENPFLFPAWDARAEPPGNYRINWALAEPDHCTGYAETEFTLKSRGPAGLATTTAAAISSEDARRLTWDLINTTGKDLEIKRMDVTWFTSPESPRLAVIEFPSGRTVSKRPGGGPQSVSESFESEPLRLPGDANGLCSDPSCRVSMSLVWDGPVFTSDSGSIERVTVRYYFADESGRTRSAALVVWPDLSVRMSRPSGFGALLDLKRPWCGARLGDPAWSIVLRPTDARAS